MLENTKMCVVGEVFPSIFFQLNPATVVDYVTTTSKFKDVPPNFEKLYEPTVYDTIVLCETITPFLLAPLHAKRIVLFIPTDRLDVSFKGKPLHQHGKALLSNFIDKIDCVMCMNSDIRAQLSRVYEIPENKIVVTDTAKSFIECLRGTVESGLSVV